MRIRSAALAAPAALVLLACFEPSDRRPGTWLSGEVVEGAVDDWSFTNDHREIWIETRTPYLVPHSVTIVCAEADGKLFVAARNPDGKRWVANVDRDPAVRLKIGDRIYEQRLVPIESPEMLDTAYEAYAAKYGWERVPPAERPPTRFFEVVERS